MSETITGKYPANSAVLRKHVRARRKLGSQRIAGTWDPLDAMPSAGLELREIGHGRPSWWMPRDRHRISRLIRGPDGDVAEWFIIRDCAEARRVVADQAGHRHRAVQAMHPRHLDALLRGIPSVIKPGRVWLVTV